MRVGCASPELRRSTKSRFSCAYWVNPPALASACSTPDRGSSTYTPGFKAELHYKDLGLIMESARALGVPLPATAVVQELFNALRVKGRGGLDHSGIITLLEDLAGAS